MELDGGPWHIIPDGKPGAGLIIKDAIADAFLQQILLRPAEYDVSATLNLNGDYLSDALAAQVGGIGIAPGANINYVTGHAVFEATHGTAPKYAGQSLDGFKHPTPSVAMRSVGGEYSNPPRREMLSSSLDIWPC